MEREDARNCNCSRKHEAMLGIYNKGDLGYAADDAGPPGKSRKAEAPIGDCQIPVIKQWMRSPDIIIDKSRI